MEAGEGEQMEKKKEEERNDLIGNLVDGGDDCLVHFGGCLCGGLLDIVGALLDKLLGLCEILLGKLSKKPKKKKRQLIGA